MKKKQNLLERFQNTRMTGVRSKKTNSSDVIYMYFINLVIIKRVFNFFVRSFLSSFLWCVCCCSGPASIDDRYLRRKRSSADLGTHYPGDLLSLALPKPRPVVPPLLKRNTIGDFASTRAYQQASTASLVSPSATVFDQGL